MTARQLDTSPKRLRERAGALPAIAEARAAAAELPLLLVGGAVRDLMLGFDRVDVDLAVEAQPADVAELARRLDPGARVHDRFGTATARLGGTDVDLAATRAETYERPGALPAVRPASLGDDLARRDFTINAMALWLTGEPRLVDPHDGVADLEAGTLRTLHGRSFVDDPTRALRAARYAARLDLMLDRATEQGLRAADLATVSAERVEAELRRLAEEPDPARALRLLVDWGVAEANVELVETALGAREGTGWGEVADAATVLLGAGAVQAGRYRAPDTVGKARELAAVDASLPPSELTARARGHTGAELVIARALGAGWLDRYVGEWRDLRLEIGGADLLAAGIPEGPAIGRGLAAALAAKLDGQVEGRDQELATALEAARRHR
jgi:tRNA nucleotidyltransferase (CCA-adding enzyme)